MHRSEASSPGGATTQWRSRRAGAASARREATEAFAAAALLAMVLASLAGWRLPI